MFRIKFALLAFITLPMLAQAGQAQSLSQALTGGKPIADVRARFESVSDAGKSVDASAQTLRARLGYETGVWNGLQLTAEFGQVWAIGATPYNSTRNGKTAYPLIVDPQMTVGAHLTGLPLNKDLVVLGGVFQRAVSTLPDYRLFALPNTAPPKPGMIFGPGSAGPGIAGEVWSLPPGAFGAFVAAIPAPLGIGKVALADGSSVSGFLCEAYAVQGATEVTQFGGWRAYMAS